MANKRQLKKFIRRSCGAFAAELLMARMAFGAPTREKTTEILRNLAALQESTLEKVNVEIPAADKPRAYFRKVTEQYMDSLDEILKEMNEAMPQEFRDAVKEAAAE